MATIRLIDKDRKLVVEEVVKHDQNSLKPLPRIIHHEDKTYRFDSREGIVSVYKESTF